MEGLCTNTILFYMVFGLKLIQREIPSVQEHVPHSGYFITTGREHLQLFTPTQTPTLATSNSR